MPEPFCEPCDMPLAFCVHGNPPKPEPVYVRVGPTITAKSTSPCADCGDLMRADEDEITHTEDGWVHAHHVKIERDSQWAGFGL